MCARSGFEFRKRLKISNFVRHKIWKTKPHEKLVNFCQVSCAPLNGEAVDLKKFRTTLIDHKRFPKNAIQTTDIRRIDQETSLNGSNEVTL